jgi:hypothetical protein
MVSARYAALAAPLPGCVHVAAGVAAQPENTRAGAANHVSYSLHPQFHTLVISAQLCYFSKPLLSSTCFA